MTDSNALKSLVVETVQSPRTAARRIMDMWLSRDILWTALVALAAINAIIMSIGLLMSDTSEIPPFMRSPLILFFMVGGLQVLSVHGFYWAGKIIGGQGDMGELLSLLVWVQVLQAAAQVMTFVLALVLPPLADIFSMVASILALWITVNFIAEALRLPTLLHAVGVMVLGIVGIAFGLAILIGLIGMGAMGVPTNV